MTSPTASDDDVVVALAQHDVGAFPDFTRLAHTARRVGGRRRRMHQGGLAVAAFAVAGVGVGAVAVVHPGTGPATGPGTPAGSGASGPGSAAASTSEHSAVLPGPGGPFTTLSSFGSATADPTMPPYARLEADGWTAPGHQEGVDGKLYYVHTGHEGESVEVVWRSAADMGPKWRAGGDVGDVVGTATLDGDPATVFADGGSLTIVGPVRDGYFLTLDGSSSVDVDHLRALAAQVRRVGES